MGTKTPFCPTLPRTGKVPNDGPGPRGFPDCYYMSRTLDSTFRYVRFVKKLRTIEEEQRKGRENSLKALKDRQISDFFNRCDRRSLINKVARRVDLCMRSYEEDLAAKKRRLTALYETEEKENVRKVVVQAQSAAEAIWEDKLARLKYLLGKRNLEHEKKYKQRPLSKCTHVHPCITEHRNKEAREYQLYQMREKQAMRMQESEFDKMWCELGMKESDALAARMEIDAIERFRRDMDCKQHSDMILKQRERQREIDRENLKKEQLAMKAKYDADMRKEAEEEAARYAKRMEVGQERNQAIADKKAQMAKLAETEKLTENVWASLSGQSMEKDKAKIELMKRKERELDECNKKMAELRKAIDKLLYDDEIADRIMAEHQKTVDAKCCETILKLDKGHREARKIQKDQLADRQRAREEYKKKLALEDEYFKQLHDQLEQLIAYKADKDANDRKTHQNDLLKQIEYNRLLKERALQEELDQRKKAVIAAEEYKDEIQSMLCRATYSDTMHPFRVQMQKLKMQPICPCSKPTWCNQEEVNKRK